MEGYWVQAVTYICISLYLVITGYNKLSQPHVHQLDIVDPDAPDTDRQIAKIKRQFCLANFTDGECGYVSEMMSYPNVVPETKILTNKYRLQHITNITDLPVYHGQCYTKYKRLLPSKYLLYRARRTTHIFDNMVPKSSCTSRLTFYATMAEINNFTSPPVCNYNVHQFKAGQTNDISYQKVVHAKQETVTWKPVPGNILVKHFEELPTPVIIQGHQPYINFTGNSNIHPVYVNMFRNPVERFKSWYSYAQRKKFRNIKKTKWNMIFRIHIHFGIPTVYVSLYLDCNIAEEGLFQTVVYITSPYVNARSPYFQKHCAFTSGNYPGKLILSELFD